MACPGRRPDTELSWTAQNPVGLDLYLGTHLHGDSRWLLQLRPGWKAVSWVPGPGLTLTLTQPAPNPLPWSSPTPSFDFKEL